MADEQDNDAATGSAKRERKALRRLHRRIGSAIEDAAYAMKYSGAREGSGAEGAAIERAREAFQEEMKDFLGDEAEGE